MVGDDLRVVAANRQVCPTISEITFGNLYIRLGNLHQLAAALYAIALTAPFNRFA